MASPFMLGTLGSCGCCDDDCGEIFFVENGCGGALAGVAVTLESGGGLLTLTDVSHGTLYTRQPTATVTGDGCGAAVSVQWSAGSSSGNSGATNGGTFADDASLGTISWSNPSHAAAADGIVSICSLSTGDTGHYHKTTNFGFAVPAGATIVGIKFEVKVDTANSVAVDDHVRLVVGGTISGSNLATGTVPTGGGPYTVYGGPTTLWGLTPTRAQVNASNFGAVINYTDPDVIQGDDVSIDHTRMTVYWTIPSGITGYTITAPGAGYTAATITVVRNGSDTTGSGASVTVATYSAVTTVDSGTTSNIVYTLHFTNAGTGYTNGTGYALSFSGGSPARAAAGTFDVVGGHIQHIVFSDRGDSYASTPTVSFPGAGTPSIPAAATVTTQFGYWFTFSTGTTYALKGTVANYADTCTALPAKCPNFYTVNALALPTATTLYVTDNNGTWPIDWNASKNAWIGSAQVSKTNVVDYAIGGACTSTGTHDVAFRYQFACTLQLTQSYLISSCVSINFGPYFLAKSTTNPATLAQTCGGFIASWTDGGTHGALCEINSHTGPIAIGPPWTIAMQTTKLTTGDIVVDV